MAQQHMIRIQVRGAYDLQAMRMQMGARVCANFKTKLGQLPGEKEEVLDEDEKTTLEILRLSYKRITDGIVEAEIEKAFKKKKESPNETAVKVTPRNFKGNEVISSYAEFCLVKQYMTLEEQERVAFKDLEKSLEEYPIYNWLKQIKGIGPAMAGVILSEIDIHKANYSSSLWMLAGLDVAQDGKGRSRRQEHLVDKEYIDKDGKPAVRKGITFNPWLKTKLVGVLGSSFLRSGGPYKEIYSGYKNRLENHPDHVEKSKLHRHNMAIRYMIKIFLLDLYQEWRKLEGLPISKPYHEAKLGIIHSKPSANDSYKEAA